MEISDATQKALTELLELASKRGYLLFDDIVEADLKYSLPITAIDRLSGELLLRNVLLFEDIPANRLDLDVSEDDSDYRDMAQSDYTDTYLKAKALDPSLSVFIDEVASIKPPQHGEIKRLLPLALEGNEYAKNRLIESSLRQAIRIAVNQAETMFLDFSDCLSAAYTGLIRALSYYKPDKGSFGSYSSLWMLQMIGRDVFFPFCKQHIPFHRMEELMPTYLILKKMDYESFDYETQLQIIWSTLCECMNGVPSDNLYDYAVIAFTHNLSVDDLIEVEYEEGVGIIDCDLPSPFEAAAFSMFREQLDEVLSTLTDREQEVLRLRFGLDDGRQRTLEEVGNQFRVTRERIRQLEAKALRKLRYPNRSKRLRDYLD